MPNNSTTTFKVRYYECDSHGHLGAANYLRYMQQAAFDAHRAAGYNRQRMAELGLSLLISQSELTFKRPLFFRDEVQVSTLANAFRRVSYERGYSFALEDGTKIAEAVSEWVLVDAESGRVLELPNEMVEALAGVGVEPNYEKRTLIAPLPPAPDNVFTFSREVSWRDVTASRHMDNAAFLEYFTGAGMRVGKHYGWTVDRSLDAGLGWFARNIQIAYHQPLRLNDQVEISTWLSVIKRSSVVRNFRMAPAGTNTLVSHARMRLTLVDIHTNRPQRIPQKISYWNKIKSCLMEGKSWYSGVIMPTETKNPLLTKRFEDALVYAHQLHALQTRKANHTPYIAHLMSVAALVLEARADEDTVIAALLHDAAEDQGGEATLAEIRKRFGENVAGFVAECSDTYEMPKPPWRERKETYLAKLPRKSEGALLITLADKLHNARTILRDLRSDGDLVWEKFNGGKDGSLWYYREVNRILGEKLSGYLVEEFDRVVGEIERLS